MTKENREPEQLTFDDISDGAEKDCETPQSALTNPVNGESNSDESTPEEAYDTRDGSDKHDDPRHIEDDQWDVPPRSELGESAAPEHRPEPVQIEESIDVPTPPPYDRHLGPALPSRNRQHIWVCRTHSESIDIDDSNDVVSVVAKRLYPLRFDVFVGKQLHRWSLGPFVGDHTIRGSFFVQ